MWVIKFLRDFGHIFKLFLSLRMTRYAPLKNGKMKRYRNEIFFLSLFSASYRCTEIPWFRAVYFLALIEGLNALYSLQWT